MICKVFFDIFANFEYKRKMWNLDDITEQLAKIKDDLAKEKDLADSISEEKRSLEKPKMHSAEE